MGPAILSRISYLRGTARVEFDGTRNLSENKNSGPVAQLGARFHGMEEVAGSIPARSTKSPNNLDGASALRASVCVVFCVVTHCSSGHSKGSHLQ